MPGLAEPNQGGNREYIDAVAHPADRATGRRWRLGLVPPEQVVETAAGFGQDHWPDSRRERQGPVRCAPSRAPGWAPWPLPPRIAGVERWLPDWLHPTYRGAVCVSGLGVGVAGKLFGLSVLVTLMLLVGPGGGVTLFLRLLGVTVVAGAVGGTIHGIFRALDQWGRIGTWLRGFLAILGAVTASVILTPHGPFSLPDPGFQIFALGLAALGATILLLADDRRPGRPTPRRFRQLQNRDQLWAAADRVRARRQWRLVT